MTIVMTAPAGSRAIRATGTRGLGTVANAVATGITALTLSLTGPSAVTLAAPTPTVVNRPAGQARWPGSRCT
jgi:hypothetical protein